MPASRRVVRSQLASVQAAVKVAIQLGLKHRGTKGVTLIGIYEISRRKQHNRFYRRTNKIKEE